MDTYPALYRDEALFVRRVLRRHGLSESELDDARQDVFLVVHRRWNTYDPSRPLRPWLFGICQRVATARRRRMGRITYGELPEVADPRRTPDDELVAREAATIASRAIASIPSERREVFTLSEWEERPMPEIARSMGIPLNTAYSRLRLARADFRKYVRRAA
jgi:RNA polymerase sigma-70 factor (ECF subfamily)